jgi:hypothetical protein
MPIAEIRLLIRRNDNAHCYCNVQVAREKLFYMVLHHLYHEVPEYFPSHDVTDIGNQIVSKTE